jgi:thymidine kinase
MQMSKLYFKYSVMNSGKSMQLLATAYGFQEKHIPFILLKSTIDTRDVGVIRSRGLGKRECINVTPEDSIVTIFMQEQNKISQLIKWVFVDESQFLTEKQVEELSYIVDNYDVNVMCYGLRTDFKTKLFPGSKRLFELADTIEEIKSTCSCGGKAIVNARVDKDGNIVTEGKQVEVGAEDKYITLCRKCYEKRK